MAVRCECPLRLDLRLQKSFRTDGEEAVDAEEGSDWMEGMGYEDLGQGSVRFDINEKVPSRESPHQPV